MKEIGGDVVRAELVEYTSATPYEEDYRNLQRLTGTVMAYNESRHAVAVGIFDNGDNPACLPPNPGTPGSGGGGGRGWEPVFPMPGYPFPSPSWPGSPPSDGGGGGGDDFPPPDDGGDKCGGWIFSHTTSYGSVIAGLLFINSCGETFHVPVIYSISTSKLTPPCNDGSGVIILPGKSETPCALTKKTLDNPNVQDGINAIKAQAKNTLTDLNAGETGHKEMNDGTIVQATPVNSGHSIDFGNKSNSKGAS